MIKKKLFLIAIAIITSCKKEDPIAEDSIEFYTCKVLGTSRVSCSGYVALVNTQEATLRFFLFDANMNLLDSVETGKRITSCEYSDIIPKLKQGAKYKIVAFMYNEKMKKSKSKISDFKTHSFTVTGLSHQNSLLLYYPKDVRPGEKIFITGKNLKDYNVDCKILLDKYRERVNVIEKTDSVLTVTVDKSINGLFNISDKQYDIIVKELEDTLANNKTILYTDNPFLERMEVSSPTFLKLYGSFGNKGVDSVFIDNTKFSLEGININRSFYYHQTYLQYVGLASPLNPGSYTIRAYLNGYEARLQNVLIE